MVWGLSALKQESQRWGWMIRSSIISLLSLSLFAIRSSCLSERSLEGASGIEGHRTQGTVSDHASSICEGALRKKLKLESPG